MTASISDGVGSIDGMTEPEDIAEACVRTIAAGRSLILPHPRVRGYISTELGS